MSTHVVPFQARKPRLKHYVSLKGETGRRVYFRPERFKGRVLFPDALPKVTINGLPFTLADISMNGLAASSFRRAESLTSGAEVALTLSYLGCDLYSNTAKVVRIEKTASGTKVALNLHCGSINISGLIDAYAAAELNHDIDALAVRHPGGDRVPEHYKQICSDVLFMMREYRALLESYEQNARRNGTFSHDIENQLVARCLASFLPQWKSLWQQANQLVVACLTDKKALQAIKHYTERTLTPEFCLNPGWRWVYEKPLGYPGDHVAMEKFYLNRVEGETAYIKLIDAIGLEIAAFVRSRMAGMEKILAETLSVFSKGRQVNILNIGSGVAFELQSFLRNHRFTAQARITLLEQEADALNKAYQGITAANEQNGNAVTLQSLNVSYLEMLKTTKTFEDIPRQDLIYSLGILDYMTENRAREFLSSLVTQLNDGGKLVVANMHIAKDAPLWPLECIENWNLIYRSEADMRNLVTEIPGLLAETFIDETGHVVFLILHKTTVH
jgi:hypothetical protein